MGANSTQDGTGKQLPLVTGPVGELGDDWLHAMGATPAQTYFGSPVKLEEYGDAGRCN